MRTTIGLLIGSLCFALLAATTGTVVEKAEAACWATASINSTTADDAARAIEQAGYSQVQIYEKGCDNAWHGHAYMNGSPVNVVWNGEGQVLPEGD